MNDFNIITYSDKLLMDDQIVEFITNIVLNEYKQPQVSRRDLENLSFYSTSTSRLFLLVNKKQINGTIGVFIKDKVAIIKRFYLEKNIRSKGYGKMLFNKVIDYIRESQIKIIELNCDTRKMKKAYSFYLKRGFKVIKMRQDGYAIMRLDLSQ